MAIPDVSTELRQSLERHRFSLRPQPDTPPGEEAAHVVLDRGWETCYAGRVAHHRGLWSAFAVVRGHGLFRTDEVGRFDAYEDAVLCVLMSFTHVE
ncbi:hypothetical protein [Streptomyces sp. NPDC019224]|uniref:hypothetical protein n=1 Tax=Streptomyces sp. NPDC019224 TaxID=3154484 RepID=UPI0033CC5D84